MEVLTAGDSGVKSRPYKIGEWSKAVNDFQDTFGIGISSFYDGFITLIVGKICIDPFKFDDYLHKVHGEYEKQGLSMRKLIIQKYGKEAAGLIDILI